MSAEQRLGRLENYDQGQCPRCGHVQGKSKCASREATAKLDAELRAAFAELEDNIRKSQ